MRRDNDKNMNMNVIEEPEEMEMVNTPMGSTMKPAKKPVKIGVHVKYDGKEYLVQNIRENDEVFIAMGDETHVVDKSDLEVIE